MSVKFTQLFLNFIRSSSLTEGVVISQLSTVIRATPQKSSTTRSTPTHPVHITDSHQEAATAPLSPASGSITQLNLNIRPTILVSWAKLPPSPLLPPPSPCRRWKRKLCKSGSCGGGSNTKSNNRSQQSLVQYPQNLSFCMQHKTNPFLGVVVENILWREHRALNGSNGCWLFW